MKEDVDGLRGFLITMEWGEGGKGGRKGEKVSRKYNTAYAIEQSRVLTWEHQGLENVWGQRRFQSPDDCVLPTYTIPGVANRPSPLVAGEHERRQ